MRQFNELLWKYFVPSENRIAECKQCDKELSYKSTTHNLVMHLKTKHLESYFEFNISNQQLRGGKTQRSNLPKVSNFLIWNYFKENPDKIADCRLCEKKLSYKTTIHNLKQHLKVRHSDSYKEFAEQADVVADSPEDHYSSESDDAEELHKVTDVWRYFDTDSGKKAQCVVCKAVVVKEYEELKTHLRDNHPNLLLEILQDQTTDHSDAASNDGNEDNDNTYTEIVYLEQEEPVPETVKKHKEKPKSFPKPHKKRERQYSIHSSDDIPIKKTKKDEENDELTTFIKYITCLLKKLPAEVFSNVQMEIINTILKANNEAKAASANQSMVFNKEQLVNTSTNIITVDGITPISSSVLGHHNYTISVTSDEPKADGNS